MTAAAVPDREAIRLAAESLQDHRSVRSARRGAQIPVAFFTTAPPQPSPMSRLLRSPVDLRLLVAVTLIAKGVRNGRRTVDRVQNHVWAKWIGLPRPTERAAVKHIHEAMARLDERNLLEITGPRGERVVRLLDGTDRRADAARLGKDNPYVTLPKAFFTSGWHARLTPAAIAMLTISLHCQDLLAGPTGWWWISPRHLASTYGLGHSTHNKGWSELVAAGLLEVDTAVVRTGEALPARRNRYRINGPAFDRPAWDRAD